MRAMVVPAFGGPERLEERELPRPVAGPGELLVRVVAASPNPVDAKVRANGGWAGVTPPAVLGYDASGVVEEVGAGVTAFRPGDAVFYLTEIHGAHAGTFAEYHVVPARYAAPKPAALSHVEAAAVPLAGGTAWEAVVRRLALRAGETILVHGGAGGVGSFAVQIARAAGARVIATAGPDNQDTLRALGAEVAVDYRAADVNAAVREATGGRGVDAVFDTVGGELIAASLPVLRPFGRAAAILAPRGDLALLSRNNVTLYGVFVLPDAARLAEMTPLLERGAVRPLVDEVLPLARLADAHRRLHSGHGRGKVVLRVGEG
jgi:NADPH2:quinone reductase